MSAAVDKLLEVLQVEEPRCVASPGGTRPEDYRNPDCGAPIQLPDDVDGLFGATKSYRKYKHEKPEHRLMLWLRLNGHNNKEIASIAGYSPQVVSQVAKQPWFQEAFCRLSSEMGKDSVETYLEGEIVPTLQRLVQLRDGAESDAVRKAACDSILDRIRGKPTVRVESRVSGQIDNVVYDVAKLQDEYRKNQQVLASCGIAPTGPN